MPQVVYTAYMFENNEPLLLGIFTSERNCRKSLKEGDCYCVTPLNVAIRERITPIYLYKVGKQFLTLEEIECTQQTKKKSTITTIGI